jgi:hypothetical protein
MIQVYEDELQPVHPMLEALKSGDPERISRFSDLSVRDMDKRIIQLIQSIDSTQLKAGEAEIELAMLGSNDEAKRLYLLLQQWGYETANLAKVIVELYKKHPNLTQRELLPIVTGWLNEVKAAEPQNKAKPKVVKLDDWNTLDSGDLRFLRSEYSKADDLWKSLEKVGVTLDLNAWVKEDV